VDEYKPKHHQRGDPDVVHDSEDPATCRCNQKPKEMPIDDDHGLGFGGWAGSGISEFEND
jgi:hypothetical protein